MSAAEKLILGYAVHSIVEDYGEDERPAAILLAIEQAQSAEEVRHLGRALLVRHDTLSDPGYRWGEPMYPDDLKLIAQAIDWKG